MWSLSSNNPANAKVPVKQVEVVEQIYRDSLPLHLLLCKSWIFVKEKPDRKKKRIMHYNTHQMTPGVWWMKRVLSFSWWRSLLYRNQSIDLQNKSMDWFLFDRNFHHERVNALLRACIYWDILFDYDKIIDIYVSKYQRRRLLINPLRNN